MPRLSAILNYALICFQVELRPDHGGWVEVSVWDIVSLWFKNPEMNLGIVIQAKTSSGEDIAVGVQSQPGTVSPCLNANTIVILDSYVAKYSAFN